MDACLLFYFKFFNLVAVVLSRCIVCYVCVYMSFVALRNVVYKLYMSFHVHSKTLVV